MFYWSQRIGLGLMLLFFVSVLTFGAMNILGDPLFNIVGPTAAQYDSLEEAAADGTITPSDQEILDKLRSARAEYNLDKSLPERYAIWAAGFATGDFGVQFSEDGEPPVSNLIKERLPRTLTLLVMAQLFAAIIAIPWAVLSAAKANSHFDRSGTIVSFAMLAMPSFALGIVLKYLFSIKLDIFPQTYTAGDSWQAHLWQLTLPALTIAIPAAAVYQRLLRTDLITTLQDDFILMARSKGVPKRRVLFGHALRPSMFSFITVFAINTGALIGGTLVIERIFLIPGLGTSIVEAILREDFPVVLAIVMLVSAAFVALNLIVDVLYSLLDPRVRA
jgi:peptide/nickel transport system permease protein